MDRRSSGHLATMVAMTLVRRWGTVALGVLAACSSSKVNGASSDVSTEPDASSAMDADRFVTGDDSDDAGSFQFPRRSWAPPSTRSATAGRAR
jgi:hypothetical protein